MSSDLYGTLLDHEEYNFTPAKPAPTHCKCLWRAGGAADQQGCRTNTQGVWRGDEAGQRAFVAARAAQVIEVRGCDRFLTLSFGAFKRARIAEIFAHFATERTAACGSAPNNLEMQENVNQGYIVANPHRM